MYRMCMVFVNVCYYACAWRINNKYHIQIMSVEVCVINVVYMYMPTWYCYTDIVCIHAYITFNKVYLSKHRLVVR